MFNKINLEITNKCSKFCWMCGRRKREKLYPDLYNKEMDFELLERIKYQLPMNCLIAFHSDGEPTLYSRLGDALKLFEGFIRVFDTNGILLFNKADEIIDNCEVVTVSIIQDDTEWYDQYNTLWKFLLKKQDRKPRVVLRYLGNISDDRQKEYSKMKLETCYRQLHSPDGSFDYEHDCIKPEYMICDEILNHPMIDVEGNMHNCVRFDYDKKNVIGNLKDSTICELWHSNKRQELLQKHIDGKRNEIEFCGKCHYWGCPKG